MKYIDGACAAAVEILPDLKELCKVKLELLRSGKICHNEVMPYVHRYKQLHDMLYCAGYLAENLDDGEV